MSRFSEEDIFDYLDNRCGDQDKKRLQQLLSEDPVFRTRFEQLQAVHHSVSGMPLENSPESLSDQVMEKVKALPRPGNYRSSSIFSGTRFFIISGVMTALVAIISLFNSGYLSVEQLETTAQGYQLMEEWSLIKGVLSKKVLTNAMLVIYGVLALALLDRAVLNPIFRKKNNQLTF